MCSDVRCLAGICVEVASFIDRDGDGQQPVPCGSDCDDDDPLVLGRGDDMCDGLDNDCDGSLDEDETSAIEFVDTNVLDRESVVVPWGGAFGITEVTTGAVWLRPVEMNGRIGPPSELLRLRAGGDFVQVEASASRDGSVFFVARTDIGAALFVIARPGEANAVEVVDGPGQIPAEGQITDFLLEPKQDGWLVAANLIEPDDRSRVLLDTLSSELLFREVGHSPTAPLGVALAGDRPALATVRGQIVFLENDGLVTRVPRPNEIGVRPIASADDGIVVVHRNESGGANLSRLSSDGVLDEQDSLTSVRPASAHVRRLGDGTYAIWGDDTEGFGRAVWRLTSDRQSVLRGPIEVGALNATEISVATSDPRSSSTHAFAVLGATESGGSLRLYLTCGG